MSYFLIILPACDFASWAGFWCVYESLLLYYFKIPELTPDCCVASLPCVTFLPKAKV